MDAIDKPLQPSRQMSHWDRAAAAGAIALIGGGAIVACALNMEFWPFSNFAMYSRLQTQELSYLVLYADFEPSTGPIEVPIGSRFYLQPFDDRAVIESIGKLLEFEGEERARLALKRLYEQVRTRPFRRLKTSDLRGIRLYRATWPLNSSDSGPLGEPASKQLVLEYRS